MYHGHWGKVGLTLRRADMAQRAEWGHSGIDMDDTSKEQDREYQETQKRTIAVGVASRLIQVGQEPARGRRTVKGEQENQEAVAAETQEDTAFLKSGRDTLSSGAVSRKWKTRQRVAISQLGPPW